MKTLKGRLTLFLIFCLVSLAGTNSWAQEPVATQNGENKEVKENVTPKKEKRQKKQVEAKKRKEAENKAKKQSQKPKENIEGTNTGNAYGKDKGDLNGKDFGQARSQQAKVNAEEPQKEATDSAIEVKKSDKPAKESRKVKKSKS